MPNVRAVWRVCASQDVAYAILQGMDIAGQEVAAGAAHEAILGNTGSEAGDTSTRYDLLAMTTHGRTGLTRWATGSITERVLQHTQLPLLVVRAHAARPPVGTGDLMSARYAVKMEKRDAGAPLVG